MVLASKLIQRGLLRRQAIGDDCFDRSVLLERLVHEAGSRLLVSALGELALDNLHLMIDGSRQVVSFAVQVH